jgi:hypothetical protein
MNLFLTPSQNLREQVALEVDEEEGGTQPVRKIADYGIEVDFEILDDDERQVNIIGLGCFCKFTLPSMTG